MSQLLLSVLESVVAWENKQIHALYFDRFGVNRKYARTGMGAFTLHQVMDLAREIGADYLRLFVNDENMQAIHLYQKCGFRQVEGVYNEVIAEHLIFHEFGYEIHL